jgi:cytoskeletal protein CcmA (bactofilin family)
MVAALSNQELMTMKFRLKPSDTVSGFLDKGTNVTGELEFAGTLRIDGNFHGSISTGDTLIIGEHAIVHADIRVGDVEIHGQVFGTIVAKRRVEISVSGRIRGDILTPVLSVTPGAMIDGRINMANDRPEETTVASLATATEETPDRQERY